MSSASNILPLPNVHEQTARSAKVARLVAALDVEMLKAGKDPRSASGSIAECLAEWTDEQWLTLAQAYEINAPSATTQSLVIARYRQRAADDDLPF